MNDPTRELNRPAPLATPVFLDGPAAAPSEPPGPTEESGAAALPESNPFLRPSLHSLPQLDPALLASPDAPLAAAEGALNQPAEHAGAEAAPANPFPLAEAAEEPGETSLTEVVQPRFVVVGGSAGGTAGDPGGYGIYDLENGIPVANCVIRIERILHHDGAGPADTYFQGTLTTAAGSQPFCVSADVYASNSRFLNYLLSKLGPALRVHSMTLLREALSALIAQDPPRHVTVGSDFGWDAARETYRVPSGVITAAGFAAPADGPDYRVDLADAGPARHLDLTPLAAEGLPQLKRHVVEDLLAAHDRRVTYSLLAAVAVAVLYPFAPGVGRFALWLNGLTGAGKSFLAKLFANFFGHFPPTADDVNAG